MARPCLKRTEIDFSKVGERTYPKAEDHSQKKRNLNFLRRNKSFELSEGNKF